MPEMHGALPFSKWHGLGNDYIVLPSDQCEHFSLEALARAVCDRHRGIGADGMLLVADPQDAAGAFRVFNADGSEAELCGNGLRCAAAMWADRLGTSDVRVKSAVGMHVARVRAAGAHLWQVEMDLVPVVREPSIEAVMGQEVLHVHRARVGNPHAVVLLGEESEPGRLAAIAAAVRSSELIDGGVNVHIACQTACDQVSMWSDERGVGVVEACATGAAAVAAILSATQSETVGAWSIRMPGGTLQMQVPAGGGPVHMTGPAACICSGFWHPPANATL